MLSQKLPTPKTDRRDKKRKQEVARRTRERAERAERESEAAAQAEALAEEQAPHQQRAGVTALRRDPRNGAVIAVLLREPLAESDRKRGGFRMRSPLLTMHRANSGTVTALHLRAACRFRDDYEFGVEGASGGNRSGERIDGGKQGGASDLRLDAVARYRMACDAMGAALRSVVQAVVIGSWSVSAVARVCHLSKDQATGYLVAGLDMLSEHYWPGRVERFQVVEGELMVDPAVRDIPQERLGRKPRNAGSA